MKCMIFSYLVDGQWSQWGSLVLAKCNPLLSVPTYTTLIFPSRPAIPLEFNPVVIATMAHRAYSSVLTVVFTVQFWFFMINFWFLQQFSSDFWNSSVVVFHNSVLIFEKHLVVILPHSSILTFYADGSDGCRYIIIDTRAIVFRTIKVYSFSQFPIYSQWTFHSSSCTRLLGEVDGRQHTWVWACKQYWELLLS